MSIGMRSIATYNNILSPSFKKTQPYLVLYMYNNTIEYTTSEKHNAL